MMTIEIKGLDKTIARVNVFDRKTVNAIREQVKKSTTKVRTVARQNAPTLARQVTSGGRTWTRDHVNLRKKTYPRGYLRKAIKSLYKDNGLFGMVHAGKAGYAWLVEHEHTVRGGKTRTRPQPYMKPAENKVLPEFEREVKKIAGKDEEV